MPIRVVIAEDEAIIRLDLKETLEEEGYEVVGETGRGDEAVQLVKEQQPDLAILDVKMPGMDGFEVCVKLQALAETAKIPIIFVTANYAEEQDMIHGLEVGAYDYLVKPISRSVLLARVGVMLRIHRSEERVRQLSIIDELVHSVVWQSTLHSPGLTHSHCTNSPT